jgi:hypothetical protein
MRSFHCRISACGRQAIADRINHPQTAEVIIGLYSFFSNNYASACGKPVKPPPISMFCFNFVGRRHDVPAFRRFVFTYRHFGGNRPYEDLPTAIFIFSFVNLTIFSL